MFNRRNLDNIKQKRKKGVVAHVLNSKQRINEKAVVQPIVLPIKKPNEPTK